jgi:hypothetical protein
MGLVTEGDNILPRSGMEMPHWLPENMPTLEIFRQPPFVE